MFVCFIQVSVTKNKLIGKFIERIQEQSNPEKIEAMFDLVRKMIVDNIVKARYVESISFKTWYNTFLAF